MRRASRNIKRRTRESRTRREKTMIKMKSQTLSNKRRRSISQTKTKSRNSSHQTDREGMTREDTTRKRAKVIIDRDSIGEMTKIMQKKPWNTLLMRKSTRTEDGGTCLKSLLQ